MKRRADERGVTLVELAATAGIIVILAAIAIPVAEKGIRRSREMELRQALRTMRTAIDEFHFAAISGVIAPQELEATQMMYPKDFEQLIEGVQAAQNPDLKLKFLRRIPVDPMTGKDEWGKRSYQDEPDSTMSGDENIYDVYSLSEAEALDGTKYKDW